MSNRLATLREQRKKITTDMEAIAAKVKAETRDWSKDEMASFNKARAERDGVDEQIDQEVAVVDAFRAEATRQIDAGETEKPDTRETGQFRTLGEQIVAIVQAGKPGGYIDPRLLRAVPTGSGTAVDSDGGFLIRPQFADEMLQRMFTQGAVLSRVGSPVPIASASNSLTFNRIAETSRATGSRAGGVRVYWQGEADAFTASRPKISQIKMELKKMTALWYATSEVLADAAAMSVLAPREFIKEITWELEDAIVNGNGAGKPLGWMNSGSLISVAKETGQLAATIQVENLFNMYSRMLAGSVPKGVWFCNQDIWPQLFALGLSVGTGGVPIYLPGGNIAGAPFGTLLGRPVVPIEQAATLGTVGDLVFVDPTAYMLIDKAGIQTASSLHVRFLNDEEVFRWIYRVDGQPAHDSAVTPANGTATQSEFVALATRS